MTPSQHLLVRLARRAVIAVAVLVPVALAPSPALAANAPKAQTTPAIDVTDTTATLTAVIRTDDHPTSYRFAYQSARDVRFTPEATLPGDDDVHTVAVGITGLVPDTDHRFRVIAWRTEDRDHLAVGEVQTFRTAPAPVVVSQSAPAAPVSPAPPPAPALAPPAPAPALAPAQAPPPAPELGRSVVVMPVSGTVTVQVPGTPAFTPLGTASTVPVGAVVNTRQGAVRLTSAVPGGATQAGEFHGGLFEVRQSRSAGGATELRLRGGNFANCPRRGVRAGAAAATRRKPPVRRLWGRDDGGRFLTRGRNSVATVRGTRWITTDTCAGTRTTVTSGAVAVRDLRRKRTVLVRAGQSYLARSRR